MTRRAVVVGALVSVLGGLALGSTSSAGVDAVRVVDRTFSCEAGFVGGVHQIRVGTTFSTAPGSDTLRASSFVTKDLHEAALGSLSSEGITVNRRLCSVARRPVKLTTGSLRGGTVPPLGVEAVCETPRRVLLRVRAVFRRPVTPRTERTFGFPQLIASGDLEQAAIAVATLTGKAVAYVSVTGAEKPRLYTLRTCKED